MPNMTSGQHSAYQGVISRVNDKLLSQGTDFPVALCFPSGQSHGHKFNISATLGSYNYVTDCSPL